MPSSSSDVGSSRWWPPHLWTTTPSSSSSSSSRSGSCSRSTTSSSSHGQSSETADTPSTSSRRPHYLRKSSLRTIEEGETPYGSVRSNGSGRKYLFASSSQHSSDSHKKKQARSSSLASQASTGSSDSESRHRRDRDDDDADDLDPEETPPSSVSTVRGGNKGRTPATAVFQEGGPQPARLSENTPLLSSSTPHTDAESGSGPEAEIDGDQLGIPRWYRGPLFTASWKLAALFAVFSVILGGTLYFCTPHLAPEDKAKFKLPRSFADLQQLNALFQKYRTLYPKQILAIGVVAYLYVQTFSLPGSMYISIIFGAAYGVVYGVLLSDVCEASGALLCYTASAICGPPLLTIPAYRSRLETWRKKILGDEEKGEQVGWDGVFAFLIILRIAPFPPHWIANVVAPHLGISPILFWCACFLGITPISVIHCTIGSGLDSMTSAEDFHLLSVRNVLALVGVAVAVLVPVALKRVFQKKLSGFEAPDIRVEDVDDEEDRPRAMDPREALSIIQDEDEEVVAVVYEGGELEGDDPEDEAEEELNQNVIADYGAIARQPEDQQLPRWKFWR